MKENQKLERVRSYWDVLGASAPEGYADHWLDDQGQPLPDDLFREIADYVEQLVPKEINNVRVLEVGCGTGAILKELQKNNSIELWACDFSEEQVLRARNAAEKAHILVGDLDSVAEKLDQEKLFDVIFLHGVTQYFPSISYFKSFLGLCFNLLNKGGTLLLMDVPIDWYQELMRGSPKVTITSLLKQKLKTAIRYKSKVRLPPEYVDQSFGGRVLRLPTFEGLLVDPSIVEEFARGNFSEFRMEYQPFSSKPINYKKFRPNFVMKGRI